MKVLIVAKTRQGSGACIGGITFERAERPADRGRCRYNERAGLEYAVGEVWEVDGAPAERVIPPHVENIVVRSKSATGHDDRSRSVHREPTCRHVAGGVPASSIRGLTQATHVRRPVHRRAHRHPPLQHDLLASRSAAAARRRQANASATAIRRPMAAATLTFVGFQEPIETHPGRRAAARLSGALVAARR